MEMTLLEYINQVLFLLPLLLKALLENNAELALNLFSRINPMLMEICVFIDAADNSKLDEVLRGMVEIVGVIYQCLNEGNGFVCTQDQFSAVRSIIQTLQDIRPIVSSSTEETLNQELESLFSGGTGISLRTRLLTLCTLCVAAAVAAGLSVPVDLPSNVASLASNT